MNPRQVYKVARREYLARVRNKAFIVVTALVPAFMALYLWVLPRLFDQSGPKRLTVSILDRGTGLGEAVAERLRQLKEPEVVVREVLPAVDASEESRRQFSDAVLSEALDGYFVIEPDERIEAKARYFARETGNPRTLRRLEVVFQETVLERMLAGTGVDAERVRQLQRSDLQAVTISAEGEAEGGFMVAFFSTLAFCMLLYMAVLINGQGMAMAIVEEKSSRLIEVVLGAVTATEFMAGKILGVLLSGLTQLAIWVSLAVFVLLGALPALAVNPDLAGFDLSSILSLRLIFYFSVFFTLGYLLYSTMFAALASTCSGTEELSQAMLPAMLPMIVAIFATFYAVPNPSSAMTRVISLIPLFTPLVMLARVNILMPPLWEVWLGILLLVAASAGVAWVAAKIFRFSLLMYGKRPSLSEIVRMLRAS